VKRSLKRRTGCTLWISTRDMPASTTGTIDRVEVITRPSGDRAGREEKAGIVQETYAPGMPVSLVADRHGIRPISCSAGVRRALP
jgi:hypothetical protein